MEKALGDDVGVHVILRGLEDLDQAGVPVDEHDHVFVGLALDLEESQPENFRYGPK